MPTKQPIKLNAKRIFADSEYLPTPRQELETTMECPHCHERIDHLCYNESKVHYYDEYGTCDIYGEDYDYGGDSDGDYDTDGTSYACPNCEADINPLGLN